MTMTAHKAVAGGATAAAVVEFAYPVSEIIAAVAVAHWAVLSPVEAQIAMALRLAAGLAVGGVVYAVPNKEQAA